MAMAEILKTAADGKGACGTYSSTIPSLEVAGASRFYALFLAILQLRSEDLLPRYTLSDEQSRRHFLAWIVVHGRREYIALQELSEFWSELAKCADVPSTRWSGGITRLLHLAIEERKDLGIDSKLETEKDQLRALSWYWLQGGMGELGLTAEDVTLHEKRFWLDSNKLFSSRFGSLVYSSRSDLSTLFDLATSTGVLLYEEWLISQGMVETSLPLLLQTVPRAWPPAKLGCLPEKLPHGVNLIGYAFGELGIGEDVRMAAHALSAAGVPFTIIDFQPGAEVRQADRSVEHWVTQKPLYATNLICLTALEHLRLYLEKGSSIFEGRYTIGYWPWELHIWPNAWNHCFSLVDEVWASSRHIQRSAQAATIKPVRYMPMAVKLPDEFIPIRTRTEWNLPQDKYIFVFSFDGNSFIQRKNPEAILKAFAEAFPPEDDSVRLLIKCMRPNAKSEAWQKIVMATKSDPRILIFDSMLTKAEVLNLYSVCDCFVSLHKAEGFGRGIAEAYLVGINVVATDYGGNIDFCRQLGGYHIAYKLVSTSASDYVEGADNFWGEPDVMHAAAAMRDALIAHRTATCVSSDRTSKLYELFSPEAVGTRYRIHLSSLQQFTANSN